jgi:hypothetical protein
MSGWRDRADKQDRAAQIAMRTHYPFDRHAADMDYNPSIQIGSIASPERQTLRHDLEDIYVGQQRAVL